MNLGGSRRFCDLPISRYLATFLPTSRSSLTVNTLNTQDVVLVEPEVSLEPVVGEHGSRSYVGVFQSESVSDFMGYQLRRQCRGEGDVNMEIWRYCSIKEVALKCGHSIQIFVIIIQVTRVNSDFK